MHAGCAQEESAIFNLCTGDFDYYRNLRFSSPLSYFVAMVATVSPASFHLLPGRSFSEMLHRVRYAQYNIRLHEEHTTLCHIDPVLTDSTELLLLPLLPPLLPRVLCFCVCSAVCRRVRHALHTECALNFMQWRTV